MGASWSRITRDLYDKLTVVFREHPAQYTLASRRAICTRATAKRAYLLGHPQLGFKAISAVLEEEHEAARSAAREAAARAQAEADGVRERARAEAIDAAAQEKQMLKAARGDVLAALVVAAELVPAMRNVAKAVSAACAPGPDGSPPAIAPAQAMQLLTRHATLIQKAVGAAEAVIQLSRLDRGATTANIGVSPTEDLSLEAALEELEALDETLTAARTRNRPAFPRNGAARALPAPDED